MRGERRKASRRTAKAGAFTLVELLTVIGIIGILVAIIMPTLAKAKDLARQAKTQALLNALEKGLVQFEVETKLGDQYPPSLMGSPNPPSFIGTGTAYGAHTLLWAVAGADLRGTIGFSVPQTNYNDANGRFGPYVALSQLGVGKPRAEDGFSGECMNYNTVLDAFGFPVLYYRANAKTYSVADNAPFTSVGSPGEALGSNFVTAIQDTRIPGGAYAPLNPDSYLLISVGIDRKFGTSDDIGNYSK